MKRHNNLYEQICSLENILKAHNNAKRGKAHYRGVREVDKCLDTHVQAIKNMLETKTYKTSAYTVFFKNDSGKRREIYRLPYFPDRIVHHCIMQVLEPIWRKTLIADTYSSIKGRGIHKGVKRVKKALKDVVGTRYCLKLDIQKFYPSIDHDILKAIIRKKIKDTDTLFLLDEIIDSAKGIPIGNYLSQYFGNLYLTYFDHWLKEVKRCKYYFRYCDDLVIFDSDKAHLFSLKRDIEAYLLSNLKLTVKSNWQVFPIDCRGVDFLGYRFFHGYTLVRKSIARKFKRRIKFIKNNWTRLQQTEIVNSVMSYRGWLKYANSYNLSSKYIDDDIHRIFKSVCMSGNVVNLLGRNKNESTIRHQTQSTHQKPW